MTRASPNATGREPLRLLVAIALAAGLAFTAAAQPRPDCEAPSGTATPWTTQRFGLDPWSPYGKHVAAVLQTLTPEQRVIVERLHDRAIFATAIAAYAEANGYGPLKQLQAAAPSEWLRQSVCQFCQFQTRFRPAESLIGTSPTFFLAPNLGQLFVAGESGGHMMVVARQHRTTVSALPAAHRAEFLAVIQQTRRLMEAAWQRPVSLVINGTPAAPRDKWADIDSHAHVQLFSGDVTITQSVASRLNLPTSGILPVSSWADYFRLYEQGWLRQRYVLTMDARERGAVLLIGDRPTGKRLALRHARLSLGLPPLDVIPDNEPRTLQTAQQLQQLGRNGRIPGTLSFEPVSGRFLHPEWDRH